MSCFFCLIWLAASKSLPYSGLQLMLFRSLTALGRWKEPFIRMIAMWLANACWGVTLNLTRLFGHVDVAGHPTTEPGNAGIAIALS